MPSGNSFATGVNDSRRSGTSSSGSSRHTTSSSSSSRTIRPSDLSRSSSTRGDSHRSERSERSHGPPSSYRDSSSSSSRISRRSSTSSSRSDMQMVPYSGSSSSSRDSSSSRCEGSRSSSTRRGSTSYGDTSSISGFLSFMRSGGRRASESGFGGGTMMLPSGRMMDVASSSRYDPCDCPNCPIHGSRGSSHGGNVHVIVHGDLPSGTALRVHGAKSVTVIKD